jgi:hypothetical protein
VIQNCQASRNVNLLRIMTTTAAKSDFSLVKKHGVAGQPSRPYNLQCYRILRSEEEIYSYQSSKHSNFSPTPDRYPAAYRHPSVTCLLTITQTLPLSSLLISRVANTPSLPVLIELVVTDWCSVCSHLLTLVPSRGFFYP